MSGVMDILSQALGRAEIQRMSRQIGADEEKTGTAVSALAPLLLEQLGRNASGGGAGALAGALDQDHDGSVLDDLGSFLSGGDFDAGGAILRHVLGSGQPRVQQKVADASGLKSGQVQQLLMMLAPIVLGALGRAKRQRNLDADGLAEELTTERRKMQQEEPKLGGLASLLDADGDGSSADEIAEVGSRLLGSLFGRR